MKFYTVEVSYMYRDTEVVRVSARCQGQAEKLALELVEDQLGGEDHEINHIKEITEE